MEPCEISAPSCGVVSRAAIGGYLWQVASGVEVNRRLACARGEARVGGEASKAFRLHKDCESVHLKVALQIAPE
jgi:hypothetical protein